MYIYNIIITKAITLLQEETNTTKKNEAILTKVRSKGEDAYKDFKERLKITNQSKLAELLAYTERGLSTEKIEQHLNKILKEQITYTVYDKQKRGK
jgi:UTP:GlnB (protein PII) uridylyltransferase